jgi:DNA-binding LacI/PurR family transcriptional regulator
LTAVIVTDDCGAVRLIEYLHKHTSVRVPEALSVASFHRSPFSSYCCPDLSTVAFDFFGGGKQAAEALIRTFLTGASLENIVLAGKIIEGSTVAPKNFSDRDISVTARQSID